MGEVRELSCPSCAGSALEPGHIRAHVGLETSFIPDDARGLGRFFGTADVPLQALLCTDCGHVALFASAAVG